MRAFRMPFGATTPTAQEVRDQLRRILESDRFRKAPIQSEVLTIVVERALAGEPINETDLTPGRFDADSTKGRANASLVRDKLAQYYSGEGKDDVISVLFPPGASYKPEFTLNGNSEAVRYFMKGMMHRGDFSLRSLMLAGDAFAIANRQSRAHAFALAALIETRLLISIALSLLSVIHHPEFRYVLGATADEINTLRTNFPERSWQADLFAGVAALLRADWPGTQRLFDSAMRGNPNEVGASRWYAMYLAFFGRYPEAELIIKAHLEANPLEPLINLAAAAFYYFNGEHLLALEHNRRAYRPDGEGSDACHLLFGLLQLAAHHPDKALMSFSKISTEDWIAQPGPSHRVPITLDRFPGLKILATGLQNGKQRTRRLQKELAYPSDEDGVDLKPPPLPFLEAHVAVPPREWRPMQQAFALMAIGETVKAVSRMRSAYEEDGTSLAWSAMLPVFDMLRESEPFKELYRDIAYPATIRLVSWKTAISGLEALFGND
jgi:tetratricopeptide (TPR) repeat protein